jgi:probable HAF family extracellular repeat protein
MKTMLALVAAGTVFGTIAIAHSAPRYLVTDLGTLGGTYSYAYGIDNAGRVAGGSARPNQTGGVSQTAFLWHRGQLKDLGTLGGSTCPDCNSEAGGPNASGEAAVISETSDQDPNGEDFCGFGTHRGCLAAVWKKHGVLTPLPVLPGGHNAQAYWLNNHGEVVGFSENGTRDSTCAVPFQVLRFDAVKWGPGGEIQRLPPLKGDTVAFAFGSNERGQVVGVSGLCSNTSLPPNAPPGGPHAVLWERDGSVTDLGTLPGGVGNNVATSINDRGEVVGTAILSDGTVHAFLWTRQRGMQDLGLPANDFVSVAGCCHTINNRGDVVGFSCPGPLGGCRALLWEDNVPIDLNTLMSAGSPWYLQTASSINDAGEIVGWGTINGEVHAFLARPR